MFHLETPFRHFLAYSFKLNFAHLVLNNLTVNSGVRPELLPGCDDKMS